MKECSICGNLVAYKEVITGSGIITYCPNCFHKEYKHCEHKTSAPVKYYQNDKLYIKLLCSYCNSLHGSFIKQNTVDIPSLKEINKEKYDNFHQDSSDRYSSVVKELNTKHEVWRKTNWLNYHNVYLKSIQWKEKRDQVLNRDNHLCQACLKARATEVHHLSYAHWQNEPLFELISVCHECHEAITSMDNNLKT